MVLKMKNLRHEKLKELITENDIQTQDELVERLNKLGFKVTQATVSRDIKELHIIKIPMASGSQKYALTNESSPKEGNKYSDVLRASFGSMDAASNILVIKTGPGMAMACAAALDSMKFPQIVGSIAGDDTIMCAVKSSDDLDEIRRIIENIVK